MEYSTDGGASHTAYDPSNPPTFAGNVTVEVRVAADAATGIPAGADTKQTFTTNPLAPFILTSIAGDCQVTLNWDAVQERSAMRCTNMKGQQHSSSTTKRGLKSMARLTVNGSRLRLTTLPSTTF